MSEGIFCIFLWSGMFYGRKEGEGGNKKLTYLLIFSSWLVMKKEQEQEEPVVSYIKVKE